MIQLDFYSTGASEKHFKNALEYKAERWLRENKKDINPFASLPFGHGPRMCIGKLLFLNELHPPLNKDPPCKLFIIKMLDVVLLLKHIFSWIMV